MYVRRASFVLTLTLALAAIAPARAAAAGQAGGTGPSQWAVLVGIEDGPGNTALALRGDLVFPQRALNPDIGFAIVGQIGFSRFSDSQSYSDFYADYKDESSLNLLKFGGSARFTFGRSAQFHPYADAGLGIYYAGFSYSQSVRVTYPTPQPEVKDTITDSEVSLFMHLAAGVGFQVNPRLQLGVEVGFNPYFGDVDETLTSLLASATFRM